MKLYVQKDCTMRRFSTACILMVLIGSISESVWAGGESGSYVAIGRGREPCSVMTIARDERYPQVIAWLAGYLTSFNRWQPETYDITGSRPFDNWGVWIQKYCMMNPDQNISRAAEALVYAFYPSRLTEVPREIVPPASQTAPPTRKQTQNAWNATAPPALVPIVASAPANQATPRRELIRNVQERLQAASFSVGVIDGALGPQTREALRWFQNTNGLRPTGEPDEATLDALGVR
jgi:Putative peptidoglycan binding domain